MPSALISLAILTSDEINNFNNHYESQISKNRNLIIENALNIIKEYALSNELDLILDSKNYIFARLRRTISKISHILLSNTI